MKQVKILYASIALLCASSVQAQTNLFAPKKDGVSEKEMNNVVAERLAAQKMTLENNFDRKLKDESKLQQDALADIFNQLQELKNENIKLKEDQDRIKEEAVLAAENIQNSRNFIPEPTNSYSVEEVNEELKYLIEDDDPEKVLVLDDDIQRLNKEFGENGLIFRAILGDKKIYKNSSGEYIIKPLDFELPKEQVNEYEEDYAETAPAK